MKRYYKDNKCLILILLATFTLNLAEGQDSDLDNFEDLDLYSLEKRNKNSNQNKKKKVILYDDNLYLLDDDFDFGIEEIELQKLELDPKDMETAKEYEDFLNIFFENSTNIVNNPWKEGIGGTTIPEKNKRRRKGKNRSQPSGDLSGIQFPGMPKLGKFGLSTIIGASIPMGNNLKSYSAGSNFGIHINTPFSFNLAGMEMRLGTDIYFSSMTAISSSDYPYKLTNLIGTISMTPFKSSPLNAIEIKTGVGLSPSSIGDYNKMLVSIPVDINYYLPFTIKGYGMAINLHAQETLGIPTDIGTEDTQATTEFINVGFFITTPFIF